MYFDMIILKRFELRRRDLWEIEVIRLVELLIVEHLFCQIIIIRCVCSDLSIITYLTRMNVFQDICYPSVKLQQIYVILQVNIYGSIQITEITNMHQQCGCFSHQYNHTVTSDNTAHIIRLLQDNFISPYKILYMLQPTQADHFKARNQSSGCCSSNHITISDAQLTKTEKVLKELISQPNLTKHVNKILEECAQKHRNIIQSGKKDKLQVNDQVDKFILDKVISEYINHFIFSQLTQIISSQSKSRGKQIGLWATPATWKQRYPDIQLNFLPSQCISGLLYKGYSVVKSFISNTENILRQSELLQKDGKFEDRPWISVDSQHKLVLKTLQNPQKYGELKNAHSEYLFPQLRQTLITVSSIPFELNSKANLFCTVSPNSHLCYSKGTFVSLKCEESIRFTVIFVIFGHVNITISMGKQLVHLKQGDLFLFDNKLCVYHLQVLSNQSFLCRSFIETAQRK